ncbi:MAG TPA: 2TM domain-containing protein [Acidimicrobiia bacterium]|nr:2TM domain-containing protein [Acidimicrobiia bacterium]
MDDSERREAALARVKAKREFRNHVAVYVIVNAMLVVIWALTNQGYFWPVWPMLGWGVGLVLHGWKVFYEKPISEEEIRREMDKAI